MGGKEKTPLLRENQKMFLSKNTQVFGLDIGSHSIKLAQLKKKKNSYELMNFGIMPLNPEFIVDGVIENVEGVADAIKKLLLCEKIASKYAVISIAGESAIIKKISVPVMSEEDLAKSITAEAEQYIPYDIDEVNVDFQILPREGGAESSAEEEPQMDVLLAAIKKDAVESRLQVLKAAGLHPVVVDLDIFAMENCYELNEEADASKVVALVNIGSSTTNVNILDGGITAFTRDIPVGANVFNRAIQKELGVSPEAAEQLKLGIEVEGITRNRVAPIVINSVVDITQEIYKSFEFFSTARNKEVDRIVLSGGAAVMPGLDRQIAEKLDKKTDVFNPFLNIKVNYNKFDSEYLETMGPLAAVSVGLAARRFNDKS